jgi:hypothetical protein
VMPSYLTSFETTFNPSSVIWRSDNNPVEVQISASFTETRPPTQGDV